MTLTNEKLPFSFQLDTKGIKTESQVISVEPPGVKSDRFENLFSGIRNILNLKNDQYRIDPIDQLTIDDLLCQIKIKAVRAQLTSREEKREDELMDIIVYCLLTLDKQQRQNLPKVSA